jgi:hypothetical protein
MIPATRFSELWENHRGLESKQARTFDLRDQMSRDERIAVDMCWSTMSGETSWIDAFHALWRQTAPSEHARRFAGTFYATPETMHADDPNELECTCGSVDFKLLGVLGARHHFRCRDCGRNVSR